MNKRQAEEAGFTFTGIYSHDKEEVKVRAAELRKAGNKAVVVAVTPSKYSRGHRGTSYSVYWIESEANFAIRLQKSNEVLRRNLLVKREALLEELAQIDAKIAAI